MVFWLPVIILSYFFFSLAYLGDKLVLVGAPKPKSYTFFIGLLGALSVVLLPFIAFELPNPTTWFWIICESLVYVAGLYAMFVALEKNDVSVVITTTGATQPIFVFILAFLFWGPQSVKLAYVIAFLLLLIGSIVISLNKKFSIAGNYLGLILLASLMFSLDYIFSKLVFLQLSFLQGFIWMRLVGGVLVLFFLISSSFRKEIFTKQNVLGKKTGVLFFGTQACGGLANFLQSFAIFLAPVTFLPIINAMRGLQYVFLFLLTLLITLYFPTILQEKISKGVVFQKSLAIILIVIGLTLISLY